jgi:hypothetical protein
MLATEHSFLGTIALVFLAIAILFSFDTFMAKLEHTEDQAEARRLFADGQRLRAQGRNQLATDFEARSRLAAAIATIPLRWAKPCLSRDRLRKQRQPSMTC